MTFKIPLAILLFILFAPHITMAQESFSFSTTTFQFNKVPAKSVSTDINSDNLDDVVLLSNNTQAPGPLKVYLNSSSTFDTATSYVTVDNNYKAYRTNNVNDFYYTNDSYSPSDLAVGDVDGDGIKDILVSNWGEPSYVNASRHGIPGGIAVLTGNSNSSFTLKQSYQFNTVDENPTSIKLGDIDNDGDLDAVTLLRSEVVTFSNNSVGIFTEFDRINLDDLASFAGRQIDIQLSDTDNDGDQDIMMSYNKEFRIYRNNGFGQYGQPETYTSFPSTIASQFLKVFSPHIIDFDVDGDDDVLLLKQVSRLVNPSSFIGYRNGMILSQVGYMVNDGTGTFQYQEGELLPISVMGDVNITNFDSDEYKDIIFSGLNAITTVTSDVILLKGNGQNSNFVSQKIVSGFNSVGEGYFKSGNAANLNGDYLKDLYYFENLGKLHTFIQVVPIQNNTAPIITQINNQITTEGTELIFTLSATDEDNDAITYSASNLPAGATLDETTGLFTWTPDFNDAGTYEVTFTATEDTPEALSDSETVTVSVINFNRAPELAGIGNQTINEGDTLEFTVSATDQDGDDVTITANNLPSGATFNGTTFFWNTSYTDAGNYENIEFTATDNGTPMELDVELITITVGDVNRAPILTNPGPQEVLEEETVSFTISATDPDGDNTTLTATNLPSGASFNGATFFWTPDLSDEGVYTVTFTATDSSTPTESASTDVVITVGNNPTPVEQAQDLVEIVVTLDLPQNVENSYLANLQKVGQFIEEGKITPALNQLNAFKNKVQQDYQQGRLTQAQYQQLTAAANALIADLQG